MPAVLIRNCYGKSRIRLTKVTRHADRHDIHELTIEILLEGDFAASYTDGDNSLIVATDTMKNVTYALARDHPIPSIESFGAALTDHFLDQHAHVASATVRLAEHPLKRILLDGREHPHAFFGTNSETRTATLRRTRPEGLRVESGLDGLFLLKTTDSAFAGFLRDRYTTLPEVSDRIFATALNAEWLYSASVGVDWNQSHALIRRTLVETFATHHSLSVQHTLHAMGAAALEACPTIEQITLTMPNKHRIPADLKPFGLDNPNEVFIASDEPHGLISGTLRRESSVGRSSREG